MQFFENSCKSSKVFIVAWFTILYLIAFVLFKGNRGPGFLEMNFCKCITRQHLRCHHCNTFQNFDELFAGKSLIRMKQKKIILIICLYLHFFAVCTKKLVILGLIGHWLVILHKIGYDLAIKGRNYHSYVIL